MLNGKVNKTEIKSIEYLLGKQEKQLIQVLNAKLQQTPEVFSKLFNISTEWKFLSVEEYVQTDNGDGIKFVYINTRTEASLKSGNASLIVPWYLVEDD